MIYVAVWPTLGLSLFAETQALESSSGMKKGSTRWLAPEHIDPNAKIDQAYITARDIYAYGCTVVEVGSAAHHRLTLMSSFQDIYRQAAFQ